MPYVLKYRTVLYLSHIRPCYIVKGFVCTFASEKGMHLVKELHLVKGIVCILNSFGGFIPVQFAYQFILCILVSK